MINILLPKQIQSTYEGYCKIIEILNPLFTPQNYCDVIFDFSDLTWYDANLLSIIGACLEEKRYSYNFQYRKNCLSPQMSTLWGKNGFGKYFKLPEVYDKYHSTIAYSIFNATDGKDFGEYVDTKLLSNPSLPHMTPGLRKQISYNIQEIFGNAPMHGQCDKVFSCGQHYYKGKKLLFTIVNLGHTIQENVIEYFKTYEGKKVPVHTISWAVIEDHSTKPMINGKSGGKGLAYLHEFIKKNNGKLQICSGLEYWESNSDGELQRYLTYNFPGTIVTIEINLNDTNSYMLSSELPDLSSLF